MASATITIDVLNVPEVLYRARAECAALLRSAAEFEPDQRVARRLVELAAAFEAGATAGGYR